MDKVNKDNKNKKVFTPAPSAFDDSRGIEVYAAIDKQFEAPTNSEKIDSSVYFKHAEERVSEVEDSSKLSAKEAGTLDLGRRDFMKVFAASSTLAATACVRRPVEKVVPYVNQPVDQAPGIPVHYASTCGECPSACGVLVKTREGRPTKIEGLESNVISKGALCSLGQASLQGLYHPERLQSPMLKVGSKPSKVKWDSAFSFIADELKSKTKIAILTSGSTGSRHDFYREFLKKTGVESAELYTYEANNLAESIATAHKIAFDVDAIPRLDLEKAKLIVGFDSDFISGGVSPVYQMKSYSLSQQFSETNKGEFVQFESNLSHTGAVADKRYVVGTGEEKIASLMLLSALLDTNKTKGSASTKKQALAILKKNALNLSPDSYTKIGVGKDVFTDLSHSLLIKKSVVVAGGGSVDTQSTELQLIAILINDLIGAYDGVLSLDKNWVKPVVKSGDMQRFIKNAPELDMLFIVDCNPAFTMPKSQGFKELVSKVSTIISIQSFPNETDELASLVLPAHHYLESWGDEEPLAGYWSLRQPVLRPITDSRQAEDIFLWSLAKLNKPMGYQSYYDYIKTKWKALHKKLKVTSGFDIFFKAIVSRSHIGQGETQAVGRMLNFSDIISTFSFNTPDKMIFSAPLDQRLRDGRGAHLPVLQEIGDSLSTVAWDSYVAISPITARNLKMKRNDVLQIKSDFGTIEAPLYPMPGLHKNAVVIYRGNGHTSKGTIENGVGVDPLTILPKGIDSISGAAVTSGIVVSISKTTKRYRLAAQQKQNDLENRGEIVKHISLSTAVKGAGETVDLDTVPDLYPALPDSKEFRWGLAVDLDRCVGCSACMTACSVENNVPQVGRDQILMGREMHWIRLDRYFSGPVENPKVTFQPVMCQHCNHAPCEAVCPVFATNHDPEGINTMTYNRCVGTRYCANACPYKVRRFNWWTHEWGKMGVQEINRNPRATNPDVTVRTRGVMEKCNFCHQRIRDAQHAAHLRGTKLKDGDITVACEQTCPTNALVFGNLIDKDSKVSKLRRDNRAYLALGGDPRHKHYGIKTLPNVSYLAGVSLEESDAGKPH